MNRTTPVLDDSISTWLERIGGLADRTQAAPADVALTAAEAERNQARELSDTLFAEFGAPASSESERRTHRIEVPYGLLRIDEYRPRTRRGDVLPAQLLLHGGAFRLGAIDEEINVAFCAQRAVDSGYAVYSVEYRLAPEHPFPAALDDARSALYWMLDSADELVLDRDRVVIGGVSAGGSIAAALVIDERDRGRDDIAALLLEVPVVDARDAGIWLSEYAGLNGFTTLADLRGGYASEVDPADPLVSPLLADLRGLPPVHVMTAEYDPLRAGGEAFVERLRAAGNNISATRHLGQLHGSNGLLRDSRAARLWHAEVAAVLRDFAR